jgi:uncharacterized protein YlxP (DUF503 family)
MQTTQVSMLLPEYRKKHGTLRPSKTNGMHSMPYIMFDPLHIGTLQVRLVLRQSRSLKDKRQVVQSIKDKLRGSFNIAIAEVDFMDDRQQAVLGIAMVSNDPAHLQGALQQILAALRAHPVAELAEHELQT